MSIRITKGEANKIGSCNGCLKRDGQILEIMIGRQSGDTFTGSAIRLCDNCARKLFAKLQKEVK